MGWKKRHFVERAYVELRLAGYVYDLTPEELNMALQTFDAMQATWVGMGIRIGYALPSSPDDSDLDQDSGLPDYAVETSYLNLAKRLAAAKGKALSPETLKAAEDGFGVLLADAARPRRQQFSNTLPLGAGNRTFPTPRAPFFPRPTVQNPLQVAEGGGLDIAEE